MRLKQDRKTTEIRLKQDLNTSKHYSNKTEIRPNETKARLQQG